MTGRVVAAVLVGALIACNRGAPLKPKQMCRVGATDTSALLVEWSNLERAHLENLLTGGAIAVAYSGCELQIVPCQLAGQYAWQHAPAGTERAELGRSLVLSSTVAGYARLTGIDPTMVPAACMGATHIIDAISVGAFTLSKQERDRAEVVRAIGDANACSGASEAGPAAGCNATIQVSMAEIPGRLGDRPRESVRVELSSSDPQLRWDVLVDDRAVCTTPCAKWIGPRQSLAMRLRDKPGEENASLTSLPMDRGPLSVTAHPIGEKPGNGFLMAFGGGFVGLFGGVLVGAGASKGETGIITAGAVLLLVGTPFVIIGATWMNVDTKLVVVPLYDRGTTKAVLSPQGVTGTF